MGPGSCSASSLRRAGRRCGGSPSPEASWTGGFRDRDEHVPVSHCETTGDIADRLGLDAGIRRALPQAFERWDGKGVTGRAARRPDRTGDADRADPPTTSRWRTGSVGCREPLTGCSARRPRHASSTPSLSTCSGAGHGDRDPRRPRRDRPVERRDRGAAPRWTVGSTTRRPRLPRWRSSPDYADLKSPWVARPLPQGVATLAADAADPVRTAREPTSTMVLRQPSSTGSGRSGCSAGIWDKATRLSGAEWERVRAVPYLTERVPVSRRPRPSQRSGASPALVHERMDGSGYPRGLAGAAIPVTARLARGRRPLPDAQRGPPAPGGADARRVRGRARRPGRPRACWTPDAVTGRPRRRRSSGRAAAPGSVAGLTPREAEVLVLLARGVPAGRSPGGSSIAPRTVGSHVEHIYSKIGVHDARCGSHVRDAPRARRRERGRRRRFRRKSSGEHRMRRHANAPYT